MKKSLTLVLIFYVLLVGASTAFAVDTGSVDALCAGKDKITNIGNLVKVLLPGGVAVICIVTGIMLVRKEHMGSGMTIIVVGVIGNIILAAIQFELHSQLLSAIATMCTNK